MTIDEYVKNMTHDQVCEHLERMITRPIVVDEDGLFVEFLKPSKSEQILHDLIIKTRVNV
tara:strand:- start:243 stop:422 length:180 start_codon:yes stop_codon:yes gene_type:complete